MKHVVRVFFFLHQHLGISSRVSHCSKLLYKKTFNGIHILSSNQNAIYSVEKAALVFSLKLDSGHKLLCPWIDNACNETLARFPPTAPPVLVDNFRERCSALLQLSALPRVSSSAIDYMQSPFLEDFLGQSLMLECGDGSANSSEIEVSSQAELKSYYQVRTSFLEGPNSCK